MEQSRRRAEAFTPIRERIASAVPHRLDDKEMMQLAIACAMRESDDLLGFLFPAHVARAASRKAADAALTAGEWQTFFGHESVPLRDGGITTAVQTTDFQSLSTLMAATMRCTVAEQQQGARWKRAWSQALCYVASHLEEPNDALESVIGTIVRADYRRLEELHAAIDDDGSDTMLMARVVIAMCESVL